MADEHQNSLSKWPMSKKMKVIVLECQWADSLHIWPPSRYHQYYQTPGEELLTPTYVRALVDFLILRLLDSLLGQTKFSDLGTKDPKVKNSTDTNF